MSEQPKHTPGPWMFDEDRHAIDTEIGILVADVYSHEDFPCIDADDRSRVQSECYANARLIAAAPDLFDACKLQHEAIDLLMARLIALDPSFMPSQSGKPWAALLAGNAAMTKATPTT